MPYSYNVFEIRSLLETAAKRFGATLPDCDTYEKKIENKVRQLKDILKGMRVAIDSSATPRPLSLARFLLTHDIDVFAVYLDAVDRAEEADFYFLKSITPACRYARPCIINVAFCRETK